MNFLRGSKRNFDQPGANRKKNNSRTQWKNKNSMQWGKKIWLLEVGIERSGRIEE